MIDRHENVKTSLRPRSATIWTLVVLACLVACGCSNDLSTSYGQQQAIGEPDSVNGTAVFAEMFRRAGHDVLPWRGLSPRLFDKADCIVWFPDDFDPPGGKVANWLEDWLYEEPGRTLIFVGRDFDAAPWYWDKINPLLSNEQKAEAKSRRAVEQTEFKLERQGMAESNECRWLTYQQEYRHRKVTTLGGDYEWLENIDPSKLDIELNGRVLPSEYAEVVLHSEGDMLVSVESFDESRLIVVANGSFLLNLTLVNKEHRKLAGKLIDEVGPPKQTVVFLESGPGGPRIYENEPLPEIQTGMEIFNIWPTNWILLHLAAVGIIYCFSRAPIFGIPATRSPTAHPISASTSKPSANFSNVPATSNMLWRNWGSTSR